MTAKEAEQDTEPKPLQVKLEDATELPSVVAASNNFGFELYRELAKDPANTNLFLSPYSVSSALMMTIEGARGDTAREMGAALQFPDNLLNTDDNQSNSPWQKNPVHLGFAAINQLLLGKDDAQISEIKEAIALKREQLEAAKQKLAEIKRTGEWKALPEAEQAEQLVADELNAALAQINQYELNVANALWGEKTYPFDPNFTKTINQYYGTGGVFSADFINAFPEERNRINSWVEDNTNNRIENLIPQIPTEVAKDLRLIVVNALFFKGEWAEPFGEAETKQEPFYLADGSTAQTTLMQNPEHPSARYAAFNADGSVFDTPLRQQAGQTGGLYPAESGFAMLELPYKGDELSMVLVAPFEADGLEAIEQSITATSLTRWLEALQQRKTHVVMPRFTLEQSFQLKQPLQAMGIDHAFNLRTADFSALTLSTDPNDRLFISEVVHKTFLEVSEKGTEAAAATAVVMMRTTSMRKTFPFTPVFRADKPFLFLIRDKRTGVVLFLGRLSTPLPEQTN